MYILAGDQRPAGFQTGSARGNDLSTPNLPTNIVDFRGFDSNIILI